MFNHAPENYPCPICLAIGEIESEETWIKQADIVYRDEQVIAFIGSKFVKGNDGYPLVVPLKHFENLYDLPADYHERIMAVSQKLAIALKQVRGCDGITIVQNNEPAGDQHAFHYHLHVIPRFAGDHLHEELMHARVSDPAERIEYANALRAAL